MIYDDLDQFRPVFWTHDQIGAALRSRSTAIKLTPFAQFCIDRLNIPCRDALRIHAALLHSQSQDHHHKP